MFRIATADLRNPALSAELLAGRVQDYGPKTMSDGLSSDDADNVYVTDPEHSAVLILKPDRTLATLVKDAKLRWPDGLSFGPAGWLYVTCSSLQHVLFVAPGHQAAHAPYHVFRFKPGFEAAAGH
jgi:sugar lactone lactonase YvrE